MKISIITWIYNRAHLLKYSLQALGEQLPQGAEVELLVADDASTDSLDEVLQAISFIRGWRVMKFTTTAFKAYFNNEQNCPAPYYNALVRASTGEYIIKTDPEFILVTNNFITNTLDLLESGKASMVMPLPHHVREFEYRSLADIRDKWHGYEYATHINAQTAATSNVYYLCSFKRNAYTTLGGVDHRFVFGIGSEDNHLLEQWRRRFGSESVQTLIDKHGLHMHHGGFSEGVPQELHHLVDLNVQLRRALAYEYPNGGNFAALQFPDVPAKLWIDGEEKYYANSYKFQEGGVPNDGFVIGYINRK